MVLACEGDQACEVHLGGLLAFLVAACGLASAFLEASSYVAALEAHGSCEAGLVVDVGFVVEVEVALSSLIVIQTKQTNFIFFTNRFEIIMYIIFTIMYFVYCTIVFVYY